MISKWFTYILVILFTVSRYELCTAQTTGKVLSDSLLEYSIKFPASSLKSRAVLLSPGTNIATSKSSINFRLKSVANVNETSSLTELVNFIEKYIVYEKEVVRLGAIPPKIRFYLKEKKK